MMELNPSFAAFLGGSSGQTAVAKPAAKGRKKAASAEAEDVKKPAKKRAKKIKSEEDVVGMCSQFKRDESPSLMRDR